MKTIKTEEEAIFRAEHAFRREGAPQNIYVYKVPCGFVEYRIRPQGSAPGIGDHLFNFVMTVDSVQESLF